MVPFRARLQKVCAEFGKMGGSALIFVKSNRALFKYRLGRMDETVQAPGTVRVMCQLRFEHYITNQNRRVVYHYARALFQVDCVTS